MYVRVDELIKILEEEFESDEKVLLFKIKVKRYNSTKTTTNPSFPNEED